MQRNQRTIRGVDNDAWEMLQEVRKFQRIQVGAALSEAIRVWYDSLEEIEDSSPQ